MVDFSFDALQELFKELSENVYRTFSFTTMCISAFFLCHFEGLNGTKQVSLIGGRSYGAASLVAA
jgi:hypothetical protein